MQSNHAIKDRTGDELDRHRPAGPRIPSRPLPAFCVLLLALHSVGCATDDPNRRAKTGLVVGATVGAIAGNQTASRNGKFIGAAIGAITGAAVGSYMDNQQRKLEERLASERARNDIRLTRIDEETLRLDLDSASTFAINSAAIRTDFRKSLDKVAGVVGEYDRTAVHIIGHTDNTGTESYNQKLSEQRADAVTRHLVGEGVQRERTRATGRGELAPLDNNATRSGRSRNRRVEIYLKPIVEGRESEAFRSPDARPLS